MAPTYFVGSRDRFSNGFCGSAPFMTCTPPPAALKERLRKGGFARRDALDEGFRDEAAGRIAGGRSTFPI